METLENLINWAEAKGVVLNGIRPERIAGRGTGVIATHTVTVKLAGAPGLHPPKRMIL